MLSGVEQSSQDYAWLSYMRLYEKWVSDPGLDKFPSVLRVEYEQITGLDAGLSKLFESSITKGEPGNWGTFVVSFICPNPKSTDQRNVAVALPQSLIGQVFAEFPEALEDADKEQCDTISSFVSLDWNCQDLRRASRRHWHALLDPKATDWQALWILLEFVLRSPKKTHIEVILSGFDEEAYDCLRLGLEYVQNAKIYESGGPIVGRTKWLVIGRPYKDTPGSFQKKSIVLSLKQEMEGMYILHFTEFRAN
jgi:hypothetical protein